MSRQATMDQGGIIYLACPYTSPDPELRAHRFRRANEAAGALISGGHFVFSPISHSHPIAEAHRLPTDFEFWRRWNRAMLIRCNALYVLKLTGWEHSRGVQWEIEQADRFDMPRVDLEADFGMP